MFQAHLAGPSGERNMLKAGHARVGGWLTGVVLCCSMAQTGRAQDATPGASQDEINKELMQRVHDLEALVKQLQDKQATPAAPPEPPAMVEAPRVNVVAPRLKFQVFGDVGAQGSDREATTNSFQVGSFDLFMTSRLSDRVSVLGELVLIPQSDNVVETDLERLELQYKFSDHFIFGAGRYHTTIGYYNTAYHHGQFFQTPIGRPIMFSFDDDGGFLPLQQIGITINGTIPSGKWNLKYVAEMGNGRAHALDVEPAQNKTDNNNAKAVDFALTSEPNRVPGLLLGFSYYHDYVNPTVPPNISEHIMVASVIYQNSKYELLNEAMLIKDSEIGGRTFHLPGFYSQFSRAFGKYRPYVRYAYDNADRNDPLYNGADGSAPVSRNNDFSLGIRYELADYAAVKLQYDRWEQRDEEGWNRIAAQFAFTF
jgi:hypothetical protein